MDAEVKRFIKSFELHSSRMWFYKDECLEKGAVGRNNRATTAILKYVDRIKANPEKYSDVLLGYLNDGDLKHAMAAGILCLHTFVNDEIAEPIMVKLVKSEEIDGPTMINLMFTVGAYRRWKREKAAADEATETPPQAST